MKFWGSRCCLRTANSFPSRTLEEIFFDSVLRIEKCVLFLADLPSSRPPCESRRLSTRAVSAAAARSGRATCPCDAMEASANWPALRQPQDVICLK
jgi:hypothetical protein